jgi:hypothetical protein
LGAVLSARRTQVVPRASRFFVTETLDENDFASQIQFQVAANRVYFADGQLAMHAGFGLGLGNKPGFQQ